MTRPPKPNQSALWVARNLLPGETATDWVNRLLGDPERFRVKLKPFDPCPVRPMLPLPSVKQYMANALAETTADIPEQNSCNE